MVSVLYLVPTQLFETFQAWLGQHIISTSARDKQMRMWVLKLRLSQKSLTEVQMLHDIQSISILKSSKYSSRLSSMDLNSTKYSKEIQIN